MFLYPVKFILYLGILVLNFSKRKINCIIISFLSILIAHNSLIFLKKIYIQSQMKIKIY